MEHSLSFLPSFRQTLTVYLCELKKGLKTLVTKWSNQRESKSWSIYVYQCSKQTLPLFTTSDVGLACVPWCMSEPFQKRLRQIGISCWDPSRLWVHLKELISDCFSLNISCYWFCFRMIRICSLFGFCIFVICEQTALLEAAALQIFCLGLGAGLFPVSHRMWGILSGSNKRGFKGKRKWSVMERSRKDGGGGKQGLRLSPIALNDLQRISSPKNEN